jgi:DNA processing protein
MINNKQKYFLAFRLIENFSYQNFKKLYNYFSSLQNAWQADFSELMAAGLSENTIQKIITKRHEINLDEQIEILIKENIKILTIEDDEYPPLLKEIYDPPFCLFYLGTPNGLLDKTTISVVGTRKTTPYGIQATEKITRELVESQIAIVSGLALGIDTVAHQTTIQNKGRTIAVLGSGLAKNFIYPRSNWQLAQKIIDSGGVIFSEYPPYAKPEKFYFPQRNRIVSGISLGTLVTESPFKSGSLITAKIALDQNREVFAVPGNIFSNNSQGSHRLLQEGAKLVSSGKDILETLGVETKPKQTIDKQTNFLKVSPNEEKILRVLSHEPTHIDHIVRQTKLDTATTNSTLSIMEIKNIIKNTGNMNYVLLV